MNERIYQIKHLADVLYSDTKDCDTIGIAKARTIQNIIDELQDELDKLVNDLLQEELP